MLLIKCLLFIIAILLLTLIATLFPHLLIFIAMTTLVIVILKFIFK